VNTSEPIAICNRANFFGYVIGLSGHKEATVSCTYEKKFVTRDQTAGSTFDTV